MPLRPYRVTIEAHIVANSREQAEQRQSLLCSDLQSFRTWVCDALPDGLIECQWINQPKKGQ